MTREAKRTVLVTGGAGYVGAHACKALAAVGYLPVTYDNLVHGHEEAVKWGPLEIGDLADTDGLKNVIDNHQPDAVMHFAAYAYVGESVTDPGKYYLNNVAGTLSLLEAMRDCGIASIVFSSTCATYGIPPAVPICEDMPVAPINPYGRTKAIVEQMLSDFERAHGISWTALRYFNAAGADPDGEIGEDHDPETHLIPRALAAAAEAGDALTVFGDDYDTPDGTCIRDYIHVTDLAEAHVLALRRLIEGGASGAINLGSGIGHSVREVIESASRVTGMAVAHGFGPRRPGDPPVLVANPSLARQELGWAAKRSDIDMIMADAWRWMSNID